MKYCSNCGVQLAENTKFCANCGAPVSASTENATTDNSSATSTYTYSSNTGSNTTYRSSSRIAQRDIALAIILSFVTCGLYPIYWMIKLNDEINILAGEADTAPSGGMVFLLSLVTCGIYTFVWLYKMGEKCDKIKGAPGNSNILYLILAFLGLGLVSYCLMQDTINKMVA